MRSTSLAAALLLGVVLAGCAAVQARETPAAQGEQLQQTEASDPDASEAAAEEAVKGLVEEFGNDPASAPGRLTSSPWPDRIEVRSVEKLADDAYRVEGDIIETAGADGNGGGEPAAKRPVTLKVRKIDGRVLIDAAELGEYEDGDQAANAKFHAHPHMMDARSSSSL